MKPPPIVIAHRGASGYLPEHTLVAKALAHGLGADYLEQDVVATRDGQLVVLHDLYLDDVTDVAAKFPGRQRTDGRHYVIDFDLAELKTLTIFERRAPGALTAKYPARFPVDTGSTCRRSCSPSFAHTAIHAQATPRSFNVSTPPSSRA